MKTESAAQTVRVLIADDEPSVLQLLSDLLAAHGGFEVETVGSGKEALDRLATFLADVVLLDILMPGMSGNDTLSELRARGVPGSGDRHHRRARQGEYRVPGGSQ